jgi:DNA-binding NarL/FixJ family response regulator
MAVEVVADGSTWAPRRILSKVIDRLSGAPEYAPRAPVPRLTAREGQVLELILKARSNREIAEQLGIEERTVRAHLGRLMRKAGVDNRIKLSMSELSHSLLSGEQGARSRAPERPRV